MCCAVLSRTLSFHSTPPLWLMTMRCWDIEQWEQRRLWDPYRPQSHKQDKVSNKLHNILPKTGIEGVIVRKECRNWWNCLPHSPSLDVTKIRTALHGLQNQHSAHLQAEGTLLSSCSHHMQDTFEPLYLQVDWLLYYHCTSNGVALCRMQSFGEDDK